MNTFEFIALIIIGLLTLAYLVFYLSKPFKEKGNFCKDCVFFEDCGEERNNRPK